VHWQLDTAALTRRRKSRRLDIALEQGIRKVKYVQVHQILFNSMSQSAATSHFSQRSWFKLFKDPHAEEPAVRH